MGVRLLCARCVLYDTPSPPPFFPCESGLVKEWCVHAMGGKGLIMVLVLGLPCGGIRFYEGLPGLAHEWFSLGGVIGVLRFGKKKSTW